MTGPRQFLEPRFTVKGDHTKRKRWAEAQAYRATWVRPIDAIPNPDGQEFFNLRRNVLGLNRKQTARLLRVGVQSVLNWERGTHPVPFYAYLALKLITESLHYKFSVEAWKGWELTQRFDAGVRGKNQYVTELVNRETGAHFSPENLNSMWLALQKVVALRDENYMLQEKVEELAQQNVELAQLSGVTDELQELRARADALLGRIGGRALLPRKVAA